MFIWSKKTAMREERGGNNIVEMAVNLCRMNGRQCTIKYTGKIGTSAKMEQKKNHNAA